MSELVAYVDGGSLGNPGPSGIGVVIDGCESGPIRIAKWIGHQDTDDAEYMALFEALQCALSLKAKALHVYSDSQVVVRQMRGEYACRSLRASTRCIGRAASWPAPSVSPFLRSPRRQRWGEPWANTAVRERIV